MPASGNYLVKELVTLLQAVLIMRLGGKKSGLTMYKTIPPIPFSPTGLSFQQALFHVLWSRKVSVLGNGPKKVVEWVRRSLEEAGR